MSDTKVAFGYTRVSTVEQADSGLSLAAQEEQLRAACKSRGWQLETIFVEQASGSAEDRPELQACVEACRRAQGVLVVTKLDRLGRSVRQLARLTDDSHQHGWGILILDLGIDTTSPVGEFLFLVLAAVAELEQKRIAERIREAMAQKKAQGWVGRPAIPEQVEEFIMELHEMGRSYNEIIAALEAEGYATARGGEWRRGTISRVVRRRKVAVGK